MKTVNISCNDKKEFFHKYLIMISPMMELRPAARLVFASMLYWNDKYKNFPKEERDTLLFNKVTRSKILQGIDMSRASLDNQFTYLRKKGVLLGNTINPIYEFFYETHGDLMFSFKIKEEEKDD